MQVSSKLYAPAVLTSGRSPSNILIKTLGGGGQGDQSQCGRFGKEVTFLILLRIHQRFVSCPARSLVAALTEISRLHIGIYFGTLSLCVCVCVCMCVYKSSSMVSYQLHLQTDTNGWIKVDQTI